MTRLQWWNVFFFQWFFVRLTRVSEKKTVIIDCKLTDVSLLSDGGVSYGYRDLKYQEQIVRWWSIMAFVLPMTGYDGYKYIGPVRYWRISRKVSSPTINEQLSKNRLAK